MQKKSKTLVTLVILSVLTLLACQTAALISSFTQNKVRPAATRAANNASPTRQNSIPNAPPDPNAEVLFEIAGTPRCTVGNNNASLVTGQILENGSPLFGQRVQASSAEGGEPINNTPAETDQDGNFQVTFVCGGSACNGSFWVWLVDADNNQTSPFVQFVFDDQCRRGVVNFSTP